MSNGNDDIYKYQPLWGKWFVELPLGRGSFGSVYKIVREDMGYKYESAVKIITVPSEEQYKEAEATLGSDESTLTHYFEDVVRNIVNEINVLYSLGGNTNIIGYQDHQVIKHECDIGWDILIRMEYVTSLRKYLKEHQMSREEVIRLGIDLCTALEVCSRKGIVHRDIKDDNIFVNEDGVFKLGDFGIARELSGSGRAASMRGTPLYMAPEVYRGDKYDAAVDIYSLGIVLYKLLNDGRMPFMPPYPKAIRFRNSEEALERRMRGDALPEPLRASGRLSEVILKACADKVEERYASPSWLKMELERALSECNTETRNEIITPKIERTGETQPAETSSKNSPNAFNLQTSDYVVGNEKTESVFGKATDKEVSRSIDENTDGMNKTVSIFGEASTPPDYAEEYRSQNEIYKQEPMRRNKTNSDSGTVNSKKSKISDIVVAVIIWVAVIIGVGGVILAIAAPVLS